MSLKIKEQFDYCYPERFDPLFGQNRLVISGLFLEGVGDLVLKDLDVASRVLRTIELGRVDIFCQERIFQWIHELHHLALANRSTSFTESFYSAMSALTDKTDARFKRRGYHSTLNKDEASEHYGFGGIAAYISYGLREARLLASCEAYKQVGELYGKNYKHCRLERPGKTRLFIISPKHRKLAKDLEGRYEGGGIITKINNEIWELQFNDYINKVDWEFEWKSILWTNVYHSIKPFLADLFDAEIRIDCEWQFDD